MAVRTLPLLIVALSACGPSGHHERPPPEVGYIVLARHAVPLRSVLPGRTSPYAVSEVRPQVNGIITQRLFTEGSDVTAGQPLYKIDSSLYRAAYDSAVAAAKAAKAKAERFKALLQQNAVARQNYDDALAAYQEAEASAQTARINLNYTTIAAPISGRIGASTVTVGALVTANQSTVLTTIATLDPIYVDITQSTDSLLSLERALQTGRIRTAASLQARVTLTLGNGEIYPESGTLQFRGVVVDQATDTVTLRALFPNPNRLLLPGMYVRATINEGVDPYAVLVPQLAVSRDAKGQATALVLGPHNKVELRILVTAGAQGNDWIVTKGLGPGDKLIVQGLQSATPGMVVRAVPASTPERVAAKPPGHS